MNAPATFKPYNHPSAWKGADLRHSSDWILSLSALLD